MRSPCTKLMAASTMIFGLVGALFPRRVLDLAERVVLVGYENPEDLEPSEWYVSATRAQSALSALAGGVVLALEYGSTCGSDSDEDAADAEDAE